MGAHRSHGSGSDFDVALWGYDRKQVNRCLEDLTSRLDEAVSKLDAVEVLYAQLCQAQLENEQLRLDAELNPSWNERLSTIMAAAEQLWSRAAYGVDAPRDEAREGVGAAARTG